MEIIDELATYRVDILELSVKKKRVGKVMMDRGHTVYSVVPPGNRGVEGVVIIMTYELLTNAVEW